MRSWPKLATLLAVLVAVPLVVAVAASRKPDAAASPTVASIISRDVPAFASSHDDNARHANDDDYGTDWRSAGTPAWLAYDLSGVPVAKRQRVLAVYYNASYGYSTRSGAHYNNPGSYLIEANVAPGGTEPPTSGWRTLASVEGNTLHSRQHVVDLSGANWVRLDVRTSDGSSLNTDASVVSFDVYDVGDRPGPVPDDFIVYGDSITAGALCTCHTEGVPSVPELISAARPAAWPVVENGGEPGETSGGALQTLLGEHGYLSAFPGTYVGLAYGMNDSAVVGGEEAFHSAMRQLVQAVLSQGKVPVIPTISYTADPQRNATIPAYNAVIRQLYAEFPRILRGPDFWTFFRAHPELLALADIHPTPTGYAAMRRQWADVLLSSVYSYGAGSVAMTGLHVVGDRIVNADGRTVRLLGVNHSGTEYACVGGAAPGAFGYGIFEPADFGTNAAHVAAIRRWGANTIRIGLNEACWLGSQGVAAAYSGAAYRQAVRDFVTRATGSGLAVILELHWSAPGTGAGSVPHGQAPMPDRERSVPMWRQVAAAFKGYSGVVFDLFNEPYPHGNRSDEQAWRCWRDGSDPAAAGGDPCAGTGYGDAGRPYPVAGMRELLDAVRAAGADNLVLLAGPQYGNDLTGWLTYRPSDPAGNLAASWHAYPENPCADRACWDASVAPVAAEVPVVATELGEDDCRSGFVDPLMSWLDERGAGYLAWTWNTWGCGARSVVADYAGTPTGYGRGVRDHLLSVTGGPPPVPAPTAVTTAVPAAASGGRLTLWPAGTTPASSPVADTAAVELGIRFTSDVPGRILGVRFYKGAGNPGPHTASVWDPMGRALATGAFAGETASGWQELRFRRPVPILAGAPYVASYHAGAGRYVVDPEYFRGRSVDSGPLHAVAGVFRYGPSGFPGGTWRASNYYVDVLFVPSGGR